MEYSYETILKKLLSDVPINESTNVYGITFIAGTGFGKSTVAKMLSKKLGLLIVANDQIRRVYDELGLDNTKYEEDIKKMAYDRTVYLLENKTSHIVDANMQFHWKMAIDNYSKHNAKIYFIELKCNEEEIVKRINIRESNFDKNDNQSRATIEDYNRYIRLNEENGIPKDVVFFTINTDTSIEEIEKQVDILVEKIKKQGSEAVDLNLQNYIKLNVFPKYNKYYSHGMIHINNVINNMMFLADYYKLDKNMAYVIASYHDIGLNVNRENHEYESGKILSKDKELKKYFNDEQIQIMKEAVEDHRGSKKERPRNFYGECVSDSDRDFDISILAKRQLATSLKNYPDIDTFNEHFKICHDYICKRINSRGVFNLWTNNPVLIQRRDKFQKDYLNVEYTKSIYKKEWDRISADGTKEKIINYYEDY